MGFAFMESLHELSIAYLSLFYVFKKIKSIFFHRTLTRASKIKFAVKYFHGFICR